MHIQANDQFGVQLHALEEDVKLRDEEIGKLKFMNGCLDGRSVEVFSSNKFCI